MMEPRKSQGHVLLSLPAEEQARHVLGALAREGIPRELLHIEHRVMCPWRAPRRAAPFIAFAVLIMGGVAGAVLIAHRLYDGAIFTGYACALTVLGGVVLDVWRHARYIRRRAAEARSGYEIVCPAGVLVAADGD